MIHGQTKLYVSPRTALPSATLRGLDTLQDVTFSYEPAEVVERVAHVRHTPRFVDCTGHLLAKARPTKDEMGWFEFRWKTLAADYNALPESVRSPIFAGLRHLYETSTAFWDTQRRRLGIQSTRQTL